MLIYFEKRFDPIDKIRWKKAEKKGENGKNGKNRKNEEMDFFFLVYLGQRENLILKDLKWNQEVLTHCPK